MHSVYVWLYNKPWGKFTLLSSIFRRPVSTNSANSRLVGARGWLSGIFGHHDVISSSLFSFSLYENQSHSMISWKGWGEQACSFQSSSDCYLKFSYVLFYSLLVHSFNKNKTDGDAIQGGGIGHQFWALGKKPQTPLPNFRHCLIISFQGVEGGCCSHWYSPRNVMGVVNHFLLLISEFLYFFFHARMRNRWCEFENKMHCRMKMYMNVHM